MDTGTLHVAGCPIRWWADGEGGPTLVLTHGGAAHSGWWGPVLPRLVERQRVVWLDFSGHGESGHRPDGYATTTWADEAAAVIREIAGGSAVVVAHSMGSRVGVLAAARHPDAVEALVTVDALVPVPVDDPNIPMLGPPKHYPSLEAAVAAFRLVPGQPEPSGPGVLAAIAEQAAGPSDGGWTWRFDRRIFECVPLDDGTNELIGQIRCPVVAVQGALSEIAHPGLVAEFAARLGRAVPLVTIPGAHHHVTLDAPDAVADVLGWLPETRPVSARA